VLPRLKRSSSVSRPLHGGSDISETSLIGLGAGLAGCAACGLNIPFNLNFVVISDVCGHFRIRGEVAFIILRPHPITIPVKAILADQLVVFLDGYKLVLCVIRVGPDHPTHRAAGHVAVLVISIAV